MSLWQELLPPGSRGSLFIGILNLTPDSFSDGGRFLAPEAALGQARRLVEAGAGMLDVGAESTRPGAVPVTPEDEWARLEPVLVALRHTLPNLPLSLDTRHPETARRGLDAGVAVLNDVTGFADPAMLDLALRSTCGLIAMRSRSRDGHLHMPEYGDSTPHFAEAALQELAQLAARLTAAGVASDRLVLDPGFGFGTTFQEDLALWNHLGPGLGWARDRICLGLSRKRFLAWRAGVPDLPPQQRDALTALAHQEALGLGYRIFRTHALPASVPSTPGSAPDSRAASEPLS